jgi:hypothetical protein
MLCSVAVHFGFFFREWVRADFIAEELASLSLVKYGMGAGATLLWMNLSGLPFFRSWFYEFFYLQHIASIAIFLWLLYMHIPSYAMHLLYLAISLIAFDHFGRLAYLLWQNISFRNRTMGYKAELVAAPGGITRITIPNVPFKWTPGQHIYLSIPRLGPLESHPFTIATACPTAASRLRRDVELQVRAHSGFTKRLFNYAQKHPDQPLRAIVQGPLGTYPAWHSFDTLFLISASTGASFTLPILESILETPGCVRVLHFVLLVQHRPQCSCAMARLRAAAKSANPGVQVHIMVAVTQGPLVSGEGDPFEACCCDGASCMCGAEQDEVVEVIGNDGSHAGSVYRQSSDEKINDASSEDMSLARSHSNSAQPYLAEKGATVTTTPVENSFLLRAAMATPIKFTGRRPALDMALRSAIEGAQGETCVAVCGGKPLSGHVRNVVSSLSDERAVHKGTGAQGIQLHVEEFSF